MYIYIGSQLVLHILSAEEMCCFCWVFLTGFVDWVTNALGFWCRICLGHHYYCSLTQQHAALTPVLPIPTSRVGVCLSGYPVTHTHTHTQTHAHTRYLHTRTHRLTSDWLNMNYCYKWREHPEVDILVKSGSNCCHDNKLLCPAANERSTLQDVIRPMLWQSDSLPL